MRWRESQSQEEKVRGDRESHTLRKRKRDEIERVSHTLRKRKRDNIERVTLSGRESERR